MRRIFTRKHVLSLFSIGLSITLCNESIAQTPTTCSSTFTECTGAPIAEDFDVTNGDFTSTGGFVYTPGVGPLFDGEFRAISTAPSTTFSLRSGTYIVGSASNTATVGFTSDGVPVGASARIGSVTVRVLNSSGTQILAQCVLTRSGSATSFTFCSVITDNDIQGQTVIFEFVFTTANGTPGIGGVSFDNFRTNLPAGAVTPVAFTSFTTRKADNGVQLLWEVGTEENVDRYEIERSSDGANFTAIGTIPATSSSSYSFTDQQPLAGAAYYRVRNVDHDGSFAYTNILKYNNMQVEALLRAFPTTTKGITTLYHPQVTGKTTLSIITQEGRIVKAFTLQWGAISTPVNFSVYPAGTYLLRYLREDGQSHTFRIIKQ